MRVLYSLSCSDRIRPEAEYAVRTCLTALGFFSSNEDSTRTGLLLSYGKFTPEWTERVNEGSWAIRIHHHPELFESVVEQGALPGIEGWTPPPIRLPLLGPLNGESRGRPLVLAETSDGSSSPLIVEEMIGEGGVITIGFDMVAAVFFFLSRVEEAAGGVRDSFGRFPQAGVFCARAGFERLPVVNGYLNILGDALGKAAERSGRILLRKLEWPGGEPYCVSPTHDVDRVVRWRGRSVLKGLLLGRVGEVCRSLRDSSSDPWWNFDRICGVERDLGLRSSFFFFGVKGGERGGRYDCLGMKTVLNELSTGGWEIALHGSYGSMLARDRLETEKRNLEKALGFDVAGVRQHYLRIQPNETMVNMEEAGFQYDASVGFSDRPGFRSSMCLPYRVFDPSGKKMLNILEVPISVMDGGLPDREAERKARVEEILESVKRARGVLSLLWHQRSFSGRDFPGLGDLYEWVLEEASRDSPYFATHGEVCAWWRKRESLTIEEDSTGSRVLIESREDIERLSLELIGARGRIRAEGAALEAFSDADRGRIRITLSGIASPGFQLILEEGSVE